jgi:hypothetical protein
MQKHVDQFSPLKFKALCKAVQVRKRRESAARMAEVILDSEDKDFARNNTKPKTAVYLRTKYNLDLTDCLELHKLLTTTQELTNEKRYT